MKALENDFVISGDDRFIMEQTGLCDLRRGELAIFCGAGISINSGIPKAHDMKKKVLDEFDMPTEKQEREQIASLIPFEIFMEALSERTNFNELVKIYRVGSFNKNHKLIALLARKGFVRTIVTTNYDCNIEKALETENLIRGKDFLVYFAEDDFSKIRHHSDVINLIKIHGCIEDDKSIRATLKSVAINTMSEKRKSVIEYLLQQGEHKKILVLGYSYSDIDLIPQIESITPADKSIIFVKHCNDDKRIEIYDIAKTSKINNYQGSMPFPHCKGKLIIVETSKIVDLLWDNFSDNIYDNKKTSDLECRLIINEWAKSIEDTIKNDFIAILYLYACDYEKSIGYSKIALDASTKRLKELEDINLSNQCTLQESLTHIFRNAFEPSIKQSIATCCSLIGVCFRDLGDMNNAIVYQEMALKQYEEIGRKIGICGCYLNLGIAYYGRFEIDKGIEYFNKSLDLAKEINNEDLLMTSYINLGVSYYLSHQINSSIYHLEKALEFAKKLGSLITEARCYNNLGCAYRRNGIFSQAIEYHENALQIFMKLGNKQEISRSKIYLGDDYYDVNEKDKAKTYYEESLKIASTILNRQLMSACYICITNVIDDPREKEELLKKYREVNEQVDNKTALLLTNLEYHTLNH